MAAIDAEVRRRALVAARLLEREARVRAVFVFGSQVDGRSDRWSDIDLAAFMEGVESWDLWHRTDAIVRVQKEAGFDIEPHLFSADLLDRAESGSFAADVMKRGVRIL